MWALYEKGDLLADSALTGQFTFDTHSADLDAVLLSIEDARQEALIRQQGREAAEQDP
jgi:RIO kinase 1